MKYSPHEYQNYAIGYIETHPIATVFLDMGLGKTSITLTAINDLLFDSFEVRRVLVIAPLRVARDTWTAEVDKWDHLQNLICSVAVGTAEERKAALMRPADIYIINRENVQWLVEESGIPFNFDMVVIDELSSFKNHNTKRFKSLLKVRPRVNRIVGLTGTPASNGLMDLWAEFRILDMGQRLGRFITKYRTDYFQPDKRNGQIIYSYKPLPYAEDAIYKQISDITISMKATDHLKMPELVSSEYTVQLSEEDKQKYDALKQELVLSLGDTEITAANAASLSGKLSQMANGAIYDDNGEVIQIHDGKLDALEDIIEAANGKPVLVAYWFKHDLTRISERLKKLHIPFSRLDDSDSIRRWNNGEIPVALIHPASAGHGLNLQSGGSTLVWFGITWSLELYRRNSNGRHSGVHLFSGKIKCGQCGEWYGSKVWHSNTKYRRIVWQCNHKFDGDEKCTTPHLTDDEIKEMFVSAVNKLITQKDAIITALTASLDTAFDVTDLKPEQAELESEMAVVSDLIEKCIYENAHVALDQVEYQKRYDGLTARFDTAKARYEALDETIHSKQSRRATIEAFLEALGKAELVDKFETTLWCGLVDFVTVHSKDDVRFTFKNGQEIQA